MDKNTSIIWGDTNVHQGTIIFVPNYEKHWMLGEKFIRRASAEYPKGQTFVQITLLAIMSKFIIMRLQRGNLKTFL
jgi:hypothetical protein